MRFSKKAKKQSGSTLAILVVLLTVMMVFGVGMIAASNNRAMQTKTSVKADQQYYAAEAAAQLGAQMLMRELKAEDLYVAGDKNTSMVDIENAFYNKLEARLKTLYDFLEPEVTDESDSPKFNGQPTALKGVEIKDLEKYVNTKEWGDGSKIVYLGNPSDNPLDNPLDNPIFLVSVESYDFAYDADGEIKLDKDGNPLKSGSRSVVAEVPVSTLAIDGMVDSPDSGILRHVGGLQSGKSEGIYSGGDTELYDYYRSGLTELLNASDADYNSIKSSVNNVIKDPSFPTSAKNWDGALDSKHIYQSGGVTLGKAGQTTTYPNLEYIRTGGNPLTILGTVYCPNLKGVWVNGLDIGTSNSNPGILHCPSLEAAYLGSRGVNVYRDSAINPMEVDAGGKVINQNKPATSSGSNNFYTDGGMMTVHCSAELNWCRFNMSHIAINYGTNGKLTSNSIFISRDWVNLSGTASSDTSRVIPQFYSRGYIKFSGSSPGNVTGIFMTPDKGYMFNNGNGVSDDTKFTGLFVGNSDKHYQSVPAPEYNAYEVPIGKYDKNGNLRNDFEVSDFTDVEYDILMDGDWITGGSTGGGDGTDGVPPTLSLNYNKGVTIREGKK